MRKYWNTILGIQFWHYSHQWRKPRITCSFIIPTSPRTLLDTNEGIPITIPLLSYRQAFSVQDGQIHSQIKYLSNWGEKNLLANCGGIQCERIFAIEHMPSISDKDWIEKHHHNSHNWTNFESDRLIESSRHNRIPLTSIFWTILRIYDPKILPDWSKNSLF